MTMDLSSIAAASMNYHAGSLMQAVSISMLKEGMEAQEVAAQHMIDMIQQSAPPVEPGRLLDVRV